MPLDRSGNYLSIFVDKLTIDYSLPKYNEAIDEIKKELLEELNKYHHEFDQNELGNILEHNPETLLNLSGKSYEDLNQKYNKINSLISKYKERAQGIKISSDSFDKLDAKELIILTDNLGHRNRLRDIGFGTSFNNLIVSGEELEAESIRRSQSKWDKFRNKLKGYFKRKKKEENTYLIDILEFFRLVKLSTEQSEKDYIDRSQPFLLAIEKAQKMGQKALVDKYLTEMFLAKYESMLRAENFNKYISEKQLVEFIKKSKKGIRLDYIKNFSRAIPDDVIEKKQRADSLYVFDNYCVLHYDPDMKSYSKTAIEQEEERKRKADPILFGMIDGSRKLYYIADWVDEYCDLTLEQFLKKSGLTEKDIEIPKEIIL